MGKIRVLAVDDSAVTRRLLTDVLAGDPELEVVGTAASGRIGLAKILQVTPDLVILDLEMPDMDGLETLAEIRRTSPRLPVIMFSALTERGAVATLDALALGANDYVTKPSKAGSVDEAVRRVREDLVPRIKALCATPSGGGSTAAGRRSGKHSLAGPWPIEVVAIGTSTGGPNALSALVPLLPADLPVPIVIVQHMAPIFTRMLAERLQAKSMLRVEEGVAGRMLEPGVVWIAPGDHHMAVVRDGAVTRIALHQGPPENSCRPAVDVLFRSVAECYGPQALGVVLTGMGQDGLRGCEHISAAGGQVLVQDEPTSVVWSMPGSVAQAGLADEVLPIERVAGAIIRRVAANRTRPEVGRAAGGSAGLAR